MDFISQIPLDPPFSKGETDQRMTLNGAQKNS
jgi:hypothetical protein